MRSFLLQDWTTVGGRGGDFGLGGLAQGAATRLDLSQFEDVVFFLDVKSVQNTVTLFYETSPTAAEGSFQDLVPGGVVLTPNSVARADAVLACYAAVPLARFVRWNLSTSTGVWQATFRIVLAASTP